MKTYTLGTYGSVEKRMAKIGMLCKLYSGVATDRFAVFDINTAKELIDGIKPFVTEDESLVHAIREIVGKGYLHVIVRDPEQEQKEKEEAYKEHQRAVEKYDKAREWYDTLTDEQKEFVAALHPGPACACSTDSDPVWESSNYQGVPVLTRNPPLTP